MLSWVLLQEHTFYPPRHASFLLKRGTNAVWFLCWSYLLRSSYRTIFTGCVGESTPVWRRVLIYLISVSFYLFKIHVIIIFFASDQAPALPLFRCPPSVLVSLLAPHLPVRAHDLVLESQKMHRSAPKTDKENYKSKCCSSPAGFPFIFKGWIYSVVGKNKSHNYIHFVLHFFGIYTCGFSQLKIKNNLKKVCNENIQNILAIVSQTIQPKNSLHNIYIALGVVSHLEMTSSRSINECLLFKAPQHRSAHYLMGTICIQLKPYFKFWICSFPQASSMQCNSVLWCQAVAVAAAPRQPYYHEGITANIPWGTVSNELHKLFNSLL